MPKKVLCRDHATTRPRDHATTRPRDHATTRPRDHATTRPRDHATTRSISGALGKAGVVMHRLLPGAASEGWTAAVAWQSRRRAPLPPKLRV
jgi:hypothetical protein